MANGAGVPFVNTGVNGNTPWGDYEGMAADQSFGTFYPAWGDDRNGANTTQINTTEWAP